MDAELLSKVAPDAQLNMMDAATERPQLAILAAQIIADFTQAEAQLLATVSAFLKQDFRVVAEMVLAVNNPRARREAILAAARYTLGKEDYGLVKGAMKIFNVCRDHRNHWAHDIWGWSPELPDALLLMEAAYFHQFDAEIKEAEPRLLAGRPAGVTFDRSHVRVYTEPVIRYQLQALSETQETLEELRVYFDFGTDAGDHIRLAILDSPSLQRIRQHTTP